jgi:hypothetical protein
LNRRCIGVFFGSKRPDRWHMNVSP